MSKITWNAVLDVLRSNPAGLTNEGIRIAMGVPPTEHQDVIMLTGLMFKAGEVQRRASGITAERRGGTAWLYFLGEQR